MDLVSRSLMWTLKKPIQYCLLHTVVIYMICFSTLSLNGSSSGEYEQFTADKAILDGLVERYPKWMDVLSVVLHEVK